jgi:transposase-like protein
VVLPQGKYFNQGNETWRTAAMKKHRGFAGLQSDRWIGSELARCKFQDERHGKRLRKLLEQLSDKIGGSIPLACQDWANTKAAYRFFSNDRVSEREILAGHFQATRDRLAATDALMLVLHDTTEFTFHRSEVGSVGILHKSYMRKNKVDARCTIRYAAF